MTAADTDTTITDMDTTTTGTDTTGTGTDTTTAAVHRLGPVEQVPPGEGRVFDVAGTHVAVFRLRGGRVYATQPACPHHGGPLADGTMGGTTLLCPLHLRRFDLTSGAALDEETDCLTTYPVEVTADGELLLRLPPSTPARPPG